MRLEEVCLGAAYKMLWEFSEDSGHHRQMFQVIMSLEQRVALQHRQDEGSRELTGMDYPI